MTKPRFIAAVGGILLVLGLTVFSAWAQNRAGGAPGMQPQGGIALLDVSRIFKNHGRFQQAMADMKTDVQAAEEAVKTERNTIAGMVEDLKGLKSGTPEYKNLEQQIATRQADLNVHLAMQRKDFLLREAKIYNSVYQEVEQEVRYFANSAGISLVLRHSDEPVDSENPETVLRHINKPVVCYAPGMDITDTILQRLNARAGGGVPSANRTGVPNPNARR